MTNESSEEKAAGRKKSIQQRTFSSFILLQLTEHSYYGSSAPVEGEFRLALAAHVFGRTPLQGRTLFHGDADFAVEQDDQREREDESGDRGHDHKVERRARRVLLIPGDGAPRRVCQTNSRRLVS